MKKVLNTLLLKSLKLSLNTPVLPGLSFRALFGRRPFGFAGIKGFGKKLFKFGIFKNSLFGRANYRSRIPISCLYIT